MIKIKIIPKQWEIKKISFFLTFSRQPISPDFKKNFIQKYHKIFLTQFLTNDTKIANHQRKKLIKLRKNDQKL